MSVKPAGEPFPIHASDEDAERFVATADLSRFDFSGFTKTRFEFQAKSANVSMRMPADLLVALKARAQHEGMPYQRFIRQTLERALLAAPERKA
ncbi:MAG: CopG family antitoxin [Beijerinckiaceae bacterium]